MSQFESELLKVLASIDHSLRQLAGRELEKDETKSSAPTFDADRAS